MVTKKKQGGFTMKKNLKKVMTLALVAAMVLPAGFFAEKTLVSAVTTPTPLKYMDFEKGFRGEGLDVVEVGRRLAYIELLDENSRKPVDSQGNYTGEYEFADTVYVSKSWSLDKGDYDKVALPAGAERQMVPDFKADDGTFWFHGTPNQATTAYDENSYGEDGSIEVYGKGNVFWMGQTLVNESYPTYATVVDWENGTYTTDWDVIVKDTADKVIEFGINNAATEFANPYTGSSATGFAVSTWIKNTNEYIEPAEYSILGDVAVDGQINANDALAVLKHAAKVAVLDTNGMLFADVNGDKEVNANDALDILKYAAKMIPEFKGETPVISGGNEETAALLSNTEFLHFEKREEYEVQGWYSVLDRTKERSYLYFSANGVVFVKDYNDATKTCTWTLAEDLQGDDLDLLSQKNGGSWNYLTYSFDGTDFHMFVNGQERTLTKAAADGYTTAGADVLALITDADTEAFLGGLGGGMKDNFNTFAIETREDFYLDDVALYEEELNGETAAAVYTEAKDKMEKELGRTVNLLKTYSFDEGTIAANDLVAVEGATSSMLPTVETNVDGRASVLKTTTSAQTSHGGTYLTVNPFAGKDELTGVTVSYWMKAIANKRGAVTDGVLVSFINDPQPCTHEKVADAYLGENSIARSQLAINMGYQAMFCEGQTKPIGANTLANRYIFRPYRYGDETLIGTGAWQTEYDFGTYGEYKNLLKTLDDKWYYVTITINNAGFKMYMDGEEVENQYVNFYGTYFFDSCWDRINDAYKNGTNNSGSRPLMDIITDETTKVYLGFAYEQSSEINYQKATNCYIDEISFYDADMNKAEVKALYQRVIAE